MAKLLDVAKAFFKSQKWSFDSADNASVLRLGFSGKNGRWPCYFEAKEKAGQAVFISVRMPAVPDDRRTAVCELLMRVNCRLNVGNFELNYDDGTVRFRSGIDVEGAALSEALMSNLAMLNVATMDTYLPGIDAVIGGATPAKGLATVEE